MDTTPTLRNWIKAVCTLIESAGFKMSPAAFHAAAMPAKLENMSFSIDIQSENTNEYRDDDYLVRARHTLTVSVMKKVNPLNQLESLLVAADTEAAMHDKLLPRSALPDTVVTWVNTRHTLVPPAREYMLLDFIYTCDVDFVTGAIPQE